MNPRYCKCNIIMVDGILLPGTVPWHHSVSITLTLQYYHLCILTLSLPVTHICFDFSTMIRSSQSVNMLSEEHFKSTLMCSILQIEIILRQINDVSSLVVFWVFSVWARW